MRDVTLDLTPFEEKISLHRYLKEALDFPFYYGANLDALHDELASERDPLAHRRTLSQRAARQNGGLPAQAAAGL